MGQRSIRKGAAWEREVAKKLSAWVTDGKSTTIFWRTRGSGGWATTARQKGIDMSFQAGDIGLLDFNSEEGKAFLTKYFLECKFIKSAELHPYSPIMNWISDVYYKAEGEANGKRVLIILKANHRKPLLIAKPVDVEELCSGVKSKYIFEIVMENGDILRCIGFDDILSSEYRKLTGG